MSSLRPGFHGAQRAVSLQIPSESDYLRRTEPARSVSLMRKYEVTALMPDRSIASSSHVAPALPVFEETAGAFARGTLIPTTQGQIAVEDLLPGDMIQTADGPEPLLWIGSTSFVPGCDDPSTILRALTRITADAFGFGRPAMDLLVGPAARRVVRHDRLTRLLGQEAVLAPVSDYVDGDRFLEVTPGGSVQLYHIMVPRHTTVQIDGIEMETYHPGKALAQLGGDKMQSLFMSMFPNVTRFEEFGQLRLARTSREVIDSLLDT